MKSKVEFVVIGVFLALCLSIVIAAMLATKADESRARNAEDVATWFKWSTVKSPTTGRCYEVAHRDVGTTHATAMMAEIPCN